MYYLYHTNCGLIFYPLAYMNIEKWLLLILYNNNFILLTIPVDNITDVVLVSPSPAELLPATLIVYVPN